MRFLIVSKGSGRGTGESQAARYVARRKPDDERRTEEPTKLFSAQAENLGDKRANRWLGDGRVPFTRDVQHLVLSFAHEEDFLALGEDEAARQQALRELTRATLTALTERLDAQELRWVAGIHRNTDHPHVHLLLQRSYVDRTGRRQRLSSQRPEWRVRYESNKQGERPAQSSPLSQIFTHVWEERMAQRAGHANPTRPPGLLHKSHAKNHEEREILGRALLAQAGLESLSQQRADLQKFSDQRRYFVTDEQGQRQRRSANDLAQQARRHARHLIASLPVAMPAPARQDLQARLQARWLAEQSHTFNQIAAAQVQAAEKLAARQTKFQQQAEPVLAAAQAIRQRYEKEGKPTPLPVLSPTALASLQERAIRQGDAPRLLFLEEIRDGLATEKHVAPRTEQELERLAAQRLLAEARLQTERQQATELAANQHLYRWEIPVGLSTTGEPQKASLASVERTLHWESDQAKFIGARAVHWHDERRAQAQERVAVLTEQRALVRQKTAERQAAIANQIEAQEAIVKALNAIAAGEHERSELVGRTLPAPDFKAAEMRELEWLAQWRGDPAFTRTLLQWERAYDARNFTRNTSPLVERTSRAFARVILAEIRQHEVTSQERALLEKREQVAVLLKASGEREATTARLLDVAPRANWERAFPAWAAQRDTHQAVTLALAEQEQRLADERRWVAQNRIVLTDAAHAYAQEFHEAFPAQPLPRPAFRPSEIARLENYLERETDPSLRAHYAPIYQAAGREANLPSRARDAREGSGEFATAQTREKQTERELEWER